MQEIEQIKSTLLYHGYEYKQMIGEGGFSNVFLCHSSKYNQDFAIKRAIKHKLTEEEYDILISMNHPNIIKIYDAFEDETAQFFVMEYCPNNSILYNGKLTYNQFVFYARQTLEALSYIHSKQIVHRDIKPENILLDKNNNVKLADFGMAKRIEYDCKSDEKCGSFKFFAPEMFLFDEFCPYKADIWALGVTFFYFATGKYPFEGNSIEKIKKSIVIGDFNYKKYKIDDRILFLIKVMTQNKINSRPSAKKLLNLDMFISPLDERNKLTHLVSLSRNKLRIYKNQNSKVVSERFSLTSDSDQSSSDDVKSEGKKIAPLTRLHSYRYISPHPSLQQFNRRLKIAKF